MSSVDNGSPFQTVVSISFLFKMCPPNHFPRGPELTILGLITLKWLILRFCCSQRKWKFWGVLFVCFVLTSLDVSHCSWNILHLVGKQRPNLSVSDAGFGQEASQAEEKEGEIIAYFWDLHTNTSWLSEMSVEFLGKSVVAPPKCSFTVCLRMSVLGGGAPAYAGSEGQRPALNLVPQEAFTFFLFWSMDSLISIWNSSIHRKFQGPTCLYFPRTTSPCTRPDLFLIFGDWIQILTLTWKALYHPSCVPSSQKATIAWFYKHDEQEQIPAAIPDATKQYF